MTSFEMVRQIIEIRIGRIKFSINWVEEETDSIERLGEWINPKEKDA